MSGQWAAHIWYRQVCARRGCSPDLLIASADGGLNAPGGRFLVAVMCVFTACDGSFVRLWSLRHPLAASLSAASLSLSPQCELTHTHATFAIFSTDWIALHVGIVSCFSLYGSP